MEEPIEFLRFSICIGDRNNPRNKTDGIYSLLAKEEKCFIARCTSWIRM